MARVAREFEPDGNAAAEITALHLETRCRPGITTEQRAAEQLSREVSQRFVHDAYLERGSNSKLTGEWVVFAKQDDIAYYLTMGRHTEEDEAIWRRCKACAAQFPCLRILQEDR
jgi:hypothetical protein